MSDKAEYMPLQPTDTSPDGSSDDNTSPYTPSKPSSHSLSIPPILFWAFLAAFGSTMLNVSLLPFTLSAISMRAKAPPAYPEPTYQPNTMIGLEKAPNLLGAPKSFSQLIPWTYDNGTAVEVNVVFPSVVAHVNQSDPERVYSEESSGSRKKVTISHENTIIMQFTNLDPTKRICVISGFRPSTTISPARPYKADGEIDYVEVWNVTTTTTSSFPKLLDASTISYDHRPPRTNYIGNIDFRRAPNSTTNQFPCPEDGSVAVEYRCQRWECWVELDMVEGEQDGERLGFELAQWNAE